MMSPKAPETFMQTLKASLSYMLRKEAQQSTIYGYAA